MISIVGQPETRNLLAGAWTGTKMIVWGGQKTNGPTEWNDGGIYDPATDTWSAMPQTGAIPAARAGPRERVSISIGEQQFISLRASRDRAVSAFCLFA